MNQFHSECAHTCQDKWRSHKWHCGRHCFKEIRSNAFQQKM